MIHEIGVELQTKLYARGCPFRVVDGPEAAQTTTWARERIVLERDRDSGDRFCPARSQAKNKDQRMTRSIGVKLTIYAQSVSSGALQFEHERRVDHVLDQVLVAIEEIAIARKNAWALGGGKFVQPDDIEKSDAPGGAAYELKFTFDRAVNVQTFAGEKRPEATIGAGGITSTTKVSRAHADDDNDPNTVPANAETSCGDDD